MVTDIKAEMSLPHSFSALSHTALVTGSTTGLGKVMALALGHAGAKVAMNYQNNTSRAERAFAEFQAAAGVGMVIRGDVTSEQDVPRLVADIAGEFGPVDILVLNATPPQWRRRSNLCPQTMPSSKSALLASSP